MAAIGIQVSSRAGQFTESVIREMTRQAILHGAVNLSQGFPDFPAPEEVKQAARDAIAADINQYAITWGAKPFREAIARQVRKWRGMAIDPETEITVCCGSTEAMIAAMLAVMNPGEEVIIFEPFYENYGPDAILSGAKPCFVPLHPPSDPAGEWTLDQEALRIAFARRPKAIIINTPNNPTGKVFTRRELELLRDLCVEFDVIAITDEIYEHILFDGATHFCLAAEYLERRAALLGPLREAGFRCFVPRGAYYIMTGIGEFGFSDDLAFAEYLVKEIGVAVVPGSSFYRDRRSGSQQVRFAFCKRLSTLKEAGQRLLHLKKGKHT